MNEHLNSIIYFWKLTSKYFNFLYFRTDSFS